MDTKTKLITRIVDTISGDTVALGADIDTDAEVDRLVAQAGGQASRSEYEQILRVEQMRPGDLEDDEWAYLVCTTLAAGQTWEEGAVRVWMKRRPAAPTLGGPAPWPRDHGGVAVIVDGLDHENVFRPARSWEDLRAEVTEENDAAEDRRRAQQQRERAILAPVDTAAHDIARLERELARARAQLDAAAAEALKQGCTVAVVARAARRPDSAIARLQRA